MKKTLFVIGILFVTVIAFTSCRKCMTCTAYENTTHIMVDQDHLCGMSMEVNQWKDNFLTQYDYGLTYAECERD